MAAATRARIPVEALFGEVRTPVVLPTKWGKYGVYRFGSILNLPDFKITHLEIVKWRSCRDLNPDHWIQSPG